MKLHTPTIDHPATTALIYHVRMSLMYKHKYVQPSQIQFLMVTQITYLRLAWEDNSDPVTNIKILTLIVAYEKRLVYIIIC